MLAYRCQIIPSKQKPSCYKVTTRGFLSLKICYKTLYFQIPRRKELLQVIAQPTRCKKRSLLCRAESRDDSCHHNSSGEWK